MYYNDILTVPVNLAGLPAMSVPAGVIRSNPTTPEVGTNRNHYDDPSSSRPDLGSNNTASERLQEPSIMHVGMQVIAGRGAEGVMVKVGLAIEQRARLGLAAQTLHY